MSSVKRQLPARPSRDLLEALRRLDRAVHQELVAMLDELGYPEVRVPHLRILLYTPEITGIRMNRLAERLQLTPGAVSQLVAHLERHGLVERVPDSSDRRAVIVRPTERTREGYLASRARVSELLGGIREAVGSDRWDVFTSVLVEAVEWQEGRVASHLATDVEPVAEKRRARARRCRPRKQKK